MFEEKEAPNMSFTDEMNQLIKGRKPPVEETAVERKIHEYNISLGVRRW